MITEEVTGFAELEKVIQQLGQVPQKVATKAARAGAQDILKATKANAPVYDGWLKAALKLAGENNKARGKKVYEITFDRAYNSKLVKISPKTGNRSYYPISQEYGWQYGGPHPGQLYMKNAFQATKATAEQKIINTALAELNKVIAAYQRDMELSNGRPRGTYRNASSGYLNFR